MPDEVDKLVDSETMAEAMAPKPKGIDTVDKTLLDSGSMSRDAAKKLTEEIRSTASATYVLVKRAYDYKAWLALGYSSWGDYVTKEFSISKSRSYQLINQAKVLDEISSVTPDGTDVMITEAQARDVRDALPKITNRVKEETEGQTPEEAAETVNSIIEDARTEKKAKKEDPWADAVAEAGKPKDEKPDTDGINSINQATPKESSTRDTARPDPVKTVERDSYDDDMAGFSSLDGDVNSSVISIGYIFSYFKSLCEAEKVADQVDKPDDMLKAANEAIAWLEKFKDALADRTGGKPKS